jgi:hypothetical protein
MTARVMMIIIISFFQDYIILKSLFIYVILTSLYYLQVSFHPYRDRKLNELDLL